jgi:hypothetical protein
MSCADVFDDSNNAARKLVVMSLGMMPPEISRIEASGRSFRFQRALTLPQANGRIREHSSRFRQFSVNVAKRA